MFRKILVPLDGSAIASTALPLARTLARVTGAQILLLRVVPDDLELANHQAADEATGSLHRIRGECARPGLKVLAHVVQGDPAEQILEFARAQKVDLIAMATYGLTGIDRLIMGSISEQVVAGSGVPVVLVRPGGRRVRRLRGILVPTDGSPGAAVALGAALPLARASGALVTLLQVTPRVADWRFQVTDGGELGHDLRVGGDYEEAGRIQAEDYVRRMAQHLRAGGYRATGLARAGVPVDEIIDTARDCHVDLIAMSTHALRGPARAILGSVADQIVHRADQPVLVVRHPERIRVPRAQAVKEPERLAVDA